MDLLLLLFVVFLWLAFSWISAFLAERKRGGQTGTPAERAAERAQKAEVRRDKREAPEEREERETHARARRQVADARMPKRRMEPRPSKAKRRLAEKITEPDGVASAVMMAEILGPPRAVQPHRPPTSRMQRR